MPACNILIVCILFAGAGYIQRKNTAYIGHNAFMNKIEPIALFDKNNYNIAMEKRRSKRIKVHLKAERISGDKNYGVFIENISENGIQMLTTPSSEHIKYTTGTDIDVKFHLSKGKTLNLHCKVRWSYLKIPPNGLTDSIGLEIIDAPLQYIEFVKALH